MQEKMIEELVKLLKSEFSGESTGHDWYHIERVWKVARRICAKEGGNLIVVEAGALLHDIADHKFVENADETAASRIREILGNLGASEKMIDDVIEVVQKCSFKGGTNQHDEMSLEARIVQDADRLDALGAIGIARTFAFGGKFDRPIYDPDVDPSTFSSAEEYRNKRSHTINHFYEKLLLLKDLMKTASGKEIADERHAFLEHFLEQFYKEWEGN